MITNRPRRLEGVSYVGLHRYFVTTCTAYRRPIFNESLVAKEVDHLHLLLMAQSEQSDLPRFMKHAKQVTGFDYRRQHRKPLWQPGYHDRILREIGIETSVVNAWRREGII